MGDWRKRSRGRGEVLDTAIMFEPGVLESLQRVVRTGALVSFGLSRDGGSLSCTVTFDGEWDRQWFRDPIEFAGFMTACADDILEETGGALPSSPPPTASRVNRGGRGSRRAPESR